MENTAVLALPAPAVTPILTEETYIKLVEAFQALGDAIVKAFEAVAEAVSEFVNNSLIPEIHKKKNLKRIKRYWGEFINGCNKIH